MENNTLAKSMIHKLEFRHWLYDQHNQFT